MRARVFHNHCIQVILGVSRNRQWKERLTSKGLASYIGGVEWIRIWLILLVDIDVDALDIWQEWRILECLSNCFW